MLTLEVSVSEGEGLFPASPLTSTPYVGFELLKSLETLKTWSIQYKTDTERKDARNSSRRCDTAAANPDRLRLAHVWCSGRRVDAVLCRVIRDRARVFERRRVDAPCEPTRAGGYVWGIGIYPRLTGRQASSFAPVWDGRTAPTRLHVEAARERRAFRRED